MYCKLAHPMTILYRFPTGELLLRQHYDCKVGLVMCDNYLELTQLQYMKCAGLVNLLPITSASIMTHYRSNIRLINVSINNGHVNSMFGWYGAENYTPSNIITCDTFMRSGVTLTQSHTAGDTIIRIPYSLLEFFSMADADHQHYAHGDVIMTGDGRKHIINFKSKILLVCLYLQNIIPRELITHIVLTACHSYKNDDYVLYLGL